MAGEPRNGTLVARPDGQALAPIGARLLISAPYSETRSRFPVCGQGRLAQLHPGRRVVARFLLTPGPPVHARALQPVGGLGRAQQMIEPKPEVALPAPRGIVPERIELLLARM